MGLRGNCVLCSHRLPEHWCQHLSRYLHAVMIWLLWPSSTGLCCVVDVADKAEHAISLGRAWAPWRAFGLRTACRASPCRQGAPNPSPRASCLAHPCKPSKELSSSLQHVETHVSTASARVLCIFVWRASRLSGQRLQHVPDKSAPSLCVRSTDTRSVMQNFPRGRSLMRTASSASPQLPSSCAAWRAPSAQTPTTSTPARCRGM